MVGIVHVLRRNGDDALRAPLDFEVVERKKRGRPKVRWKSKLDRKRKMPSTPRSSAMLFMNLKEYEVNPVVVTETTELKKY